jgi:archaellum component FlaC
VKKELLKMNDSLNKVIHNKFSSMQDQIEAIKQHVEVLKSNQSVLESKYEGLVRDTAEAMTETAKELERKHDFLMSQVVSLESYVSESTDIENDEWIVDEITELKSTDQFSSSTKV